VKVIDRLQNAVRAAAAHNPEVRVKPACILWPDPDRQWEAVVPQLQDALPEMVVLGDYAPSRRSPQRPFRSARSGPRNYSLGRLYAAA